MKIKSISFKNYKAFADEIQTIEIKPITILIGKNSSGKSSVAKLFTLLENSLSRRIEEPLLLNNNGVVLGAKFRDLVFGGSATPVSFCIESKNGNKLEVEVLAPNDKYELIFNKWKCGNIEIRYDKDMQSYSFNGTKCECVFKGFILEKLETKEGVIEVNINYSDFKMDVDYIGPFRILPERTFNLTGQISYRDTGIRGENAYAMLGVSKKLDSELYKKVGEWYSTFFDGWGLIVDDNDDSASIYLEKNKTKVNIVDVGQGMNQALPLVVRSNIGFDESIIIIEQPELHLHPAAHGDLAQLFARSAKEYNQNFIIETHSENIILRLRKLIIENDFGFTKDDLVIYWVEDAELQGKELREITVDEDGVLSDWPEGVFNENLKEILEMQKILDEKNK